MSELEIEGSFDEQWGTVKSVLKHLYAEMDGNKNKGLVEEMNEVKAELADIKAYGKATFFWARSLAALLALLIAGSAAYFASLEVRGRLTAPASIRIPKEGP